MPLVIPAGFAECSFIHQHNDTLQLAVCTMGVDTDDALQLGLVADSWRDNMLAEMNNVFTYIGFAGVVTAGTLVTRTYSTAGAGGGSGTSPQVAYLLRKGTVHAGRHGRGRMYYPGCDETSVDASGRVASGKLTGLATMCNDWLADMASFTTPVTPQLLHSDATSPYEVVSFTPEAVVATQRRRLKR